MDFFIIFVIRLVFVTLVIGWIPALIAYNKGRNFFLWWLYGGAFFIIALIHSFCLSSEEEYLKKIRERKKETEEANNYSLNQQFVENKIHFNLSCPNCKNLETVKFEKRFETSAFSKFEAKDKWCFIYLAVRRMRCTNCNYKFIFDPYKITQKKSNIEKK